MLQDINTFYCIKIMTASTTVKQVIRVLIIDDHMMVRGGLKIMLGSLSNTMHFKITEASNGEEAMHKLNRMNVDLVIIDYQMPGYSGAETIQRILRFKPAIKILALSNYDELPYIQSMMDAGAGGFVLKSIEAAEMLNAVKAVLSGKLYYCSDVAVKLIDSGQEKSLDAAHAKSILTSREKEVLKMIAMEMTNDEIAGKLHVAKRTVDTHRQNLINKLQAKNTVGLLKAALKLKLVELK